MISVVVPAHNEAAVIGRALRALTGSGAGQDDIDVVVVCNGCSDETAAIARGFGARVRVIETDKASKTHALNLGDTAARGFPRIYADADVVVDGPVARALAARLSQGDIFAAAPLPHFDLSDCSWAVRAFYAIRERMPSAREGIGGSGVYALSEQGRRRFGVFPDVTADDGFVRLQFSPQERETLSDVHSLVFPPRKLAELVKTRTRAYYGNLELGRRFPHLRAHRAHGNPGALVGLLKHPSLWVKLFVYGLVVMVARFRARARFAASRPLWERDDTSRQAFSG